jgi:hypothetical protein
LEDSVFNFLLFFFFFLDFSTEEGGVIATSSTTAFEDDSFFDRFDLFFLMLVGEIIETGIASMIAV